MPSRADNEPPEIPTLLPYLALIDVELSAPKARYSRTDFSDGVRPEASKAVLTPDEAIAPAQAVTAA